MSPDSLPAALRGQVQNAESLLQAGNYPQAIAAYTQLLTHPTALPPRVRASFLINRGFALRRVGQPQQALQDFREVVQLDPSHARAYLNIGLTLGQDLRQFKSADEAFTESIALSPSDPDAYSSRAIVRLELGQEAEATADLEQALELRPGHADALCNLGLLHLNRGRVEQAATYFQRSLEANPHDPEIRFNYALVLTRLGLTHAALFVLQEDPHAAALWTRQSGQIVPPRRGLSTGAILVLVLAGVALLVILGTTNAGVYNWLKENQIFAGLICGGAIFIAMLAFRLWREIQTTPNALHREWTLQGSAMAIRRVHQAWRCNDRREGLGVAGPALASRRNHLLRTALKSTRFAQSHLERTLRLLVHYHTQVDVIRNVEGYLTRCERFATNIQRIHPEPTIAAVLVFRPANEEALRACLTLLREAEPILARWREDLEQGAKESQKYDPVLRRSGGTLRNPFRTNRTGEAEQTQALMDLRHSTADYTAVVKCCGDLCGLLMHFEQGMPGISEQFFLELARGIDRLNDVMAYTNSPLPEALVAGETPLQQPGAIPANGLLQRLHTALCRFEQSCLR